jgi:methylphosphotriester-DNA--protein-cysteine methyltransferase
MRCPAPNTRVLAGHRLLHRDRAAHRIDDARKFPQHAVASGERLRLEAARERVESGVQPIEQVAIHTGFRDPERMRRAFLRAFGQPPQAIRRHAKLSDAAQVAEI